MSTNFSMPTADARTALDALLGKRIRATVRRGHGFSAEVIEGTLRTEANLYVARAATVHYPNADVHVDHMRLISVEDTEAAPPLHHITEYTVNALPEDHPDAFSFAITVAYRGADQWAVTRHRQCLSATGDWEWEPLPSERDEAWLKHHRFDEQTALDLAREAALNVTVNGHTVADATRD